MVVGAWTNIAGQRCDRSEQLATKLDWLTPESFRPCVVSSGNTAVSIALP